MKQLVMTIKIPIPEAGGKATEKMILLLTKTTFPEDKLPPGSTVDYAIEEKEGINEK
ncbi:hypothetical protein ES703_65769 [subsurface metagenome]